jgi:hypothetical protein
MNCYAGTGLEDLKNISQELVKVRQQIESLHSEINYEKEKYRDQMRSYTSQKSDLDVRISRAELNIKDLQRELKKLTEQNRVKNKAQADITPVLKESIAELRTVVSESLPFRLEQRLKALDEIENRLDSGIVSPNKAANQLWAYVEDELMLGKSSGIYNDTVNIDGQEKLVKVLRIGKVAMFYKTAEDQYGVTRLEKGQWRQQPFDDSSSVSELEQLFDSFNKNIRNGQFVTPNFLPRS